MELFKLAADVLVWFGHSSYFMQLDAFTFLVDPVLNENDSPVPGLFNRQNYRKRLERNC